jgi:hypothetical protein
MNTMRLPGTICGGCIRYLLLFGVTVLTGCIQSVEAPKSGPVDTSLLDLLPATTRGVLRVRDVPETGDWLLEQPLDPWQQHPADILRLYLSRSSVGIDSGADIEQLMLGQTLSSEDGFILLVRVTNAPENKPRGDAANKVVDEYQGYALQALAGTELFQTWIDERTLAIGPRSNLDIVIGVHSGALSNIRQSAIAAQLDVLDTPQPVSFVYGLPALYGNVVAPGSGESSLSQATVAMAAFGLESERLTGSMQLISDSAASFTERLLGLLPEASTANIVADENVITVDLDGMNPSTDIQSLLKTLYIDMNSVDYNEAVAQDGNAPWLNFDVGADPNSIFINFEFKNQTVRSDFAAAHLPRGFTLAPIRIVDSELPRYFLVLNIYQSSGELVEGARAEWSVFVKDPASPEPRFLVIQAAAESISADSVNLLTLPEPVSHVLEPSAISSYVGEVNPVTEEEVLYFSSRISWPQQIETRVAFDREFVAANDYIFWGNAVADRGLYNASVYNRDAVLVENGTIDLVDNSRWAEYVNTDPVHTLVYLNPLEIVISPWWNLDASYLDVTEDYRQTLIDFKNNFYPMTVLGQAESAVAGDATTLMPGKEADEVPITHYHFLLTDPDALLASVGASGHFEPSPLRLYDDDPGNYYLSLVIYGLAADPCGQKAAWRTYVVNSQGRPETLLLQTLSSDACLDPDAWLGLPAVVEQTINGLSLNTRVVSPFFHIDADLDLGRSRRAAPSRDWLEAGDRVCSPGGVCNRFFYDGQLLQGSAQLIDTGDVVIQTLNTPWNDFFQVDPIAVTVRQAATMFVSKPWYNVPPLGPSSQ